MFTYQKLLDGDFTVCMLQKHSKGAVKTLMYCAFPVHVMSLPALASSSLYLFVSCLS